MIFINFHADIEFMKILLIFDIEMIKLNDLKIKAMMLI